MLLLRGAGRLARHLANSQVEAQRASRSSGNSSLARRRTVMLCLDMRRAAHGTSEPWHQSEETRHFPCKGSTLRWSPYCAGDSEFVIKWRGNKAHTRGPFFVSHKCLPSQNRNRCGPQQSTAAAKSIHPRFLGNLREFARSYIQYDSTDCVVL